jgi:DNA-binding response OmpR family regulator
VNILVIDDDPILGAFLKEVLKSEGHQVILARNSVDGVQRFQDVAIELALVDVELGEAVCGCDVARRLKAISSNQNRFVPVILLTGMMDDMALTDCLDQGADDLVSKPFNRNLLEAKIRAWERVISWFETRIAAHEHALKEARKSSGAALLSPAELDVLRNASHDYRKGS